MTSLGIDIGGTSVKLAALADGRVLWTGQSGFYVRPATGALIDAIREADGGRAGRLGKVHAGLCVPGLLDKERRLITLSINVPGLIDAPLDDLIWRSLGSTIRSQVILNDAVAAAADFESTHQITGRLLALSLGTGVGAAVLDDGISLHVEGESPGHIGQIDVSLDGNPPIGGDGGAGSLEGYVGATALKRRLGNDLTRALPCLGGDDPAVLALSRAVRICHALYRPNHVCLLGGVGIRLRPALPILRELIEKNLTSIARPGWTLVCGDHDHHAAIGAARLAIVSP